MVFWTKDLNFKIAMCKIRVLIHSTFLLKSKVLQLIRKCKLFFFCVTNQEGETPVHYAAGLSKQLAHDDFEDTDIINLLLQYNGDTNIHTKMVKIFFLVDGLLSAVFNKC